MSNAPSHGKGSCRVLQTKRHPSNILYSFNTKDLHTTSLLFSESHSARQHLKCCGDDGQSRDGGGVVLEDVKGCHQPVL